MNSAVNPNRRHFGIIPAAGHSARMGADKLLLPWNDATVIDHVIGAWTQSLATRVIVIVRKEHTTLQKLCRQTAGVDLVMPEQDTEDMKQSIQLGLKFIASHCQPRDDDRWLVAPADLPTITSLLINRVIEASQQEANQAEASQATDSIIVPRFDGRSGHPTSFPWSIAHEAFKLENRQGINALVESHPVDFLELPADQRPRDIDTPEEYSRLANEQEGA